jgi:hypothetical protein
LQGEDVPVVRLLNGLQNSFDPEVLDLIVAVYDKARAALGLVDRNDPLTELLAKKIIEVAQAGERDRLRLYEIAMEGRSVAMPAAGWPSANEENSRSSKGAARSPLAPDARFPCQP